ncbi:23693_t:CDS:2, partial [Gigaspora rosea]
MGISIQNSRWEKDWTINAHSEASIQIKNLLSKKDFEKGTHTLCELNLWFVEQLITRQDNTMLTWQQIKRIRGLEIKGKTPIWYRKLEETILEDEYPEESKKREWVIGQRKNNMGSFLGKENKENLVLDNPSSSSITPTNKILKMRENEVEDVSPWVKRKNEGGWIMAIGFKHLKNMIAPEKKTKGKKESVVEHVTFAGSWDVYLIQDLVENREKQRELMQALEKNQ